MTDMIIETLSAARFTTYLHASGHDRNRALKLYIWNAKIGASFHVPIQAVEVALRNRINHALVSKFGPDWWKDRRFRAIIDRERIRDLDAVKLRISHRNIPPETGQIIAGLSFGFWIGMLQPKYNPPIWGSQLRSAFPNLPLTETRDSLFRVGGKIANFRNRISHHEPVIKSNIMGIYGDILELISWLCPETAEWIKDNCDVPKVAREKP